MNREAATISSIVAGVFFVAGLTLGPVTSPPFTTTTAPEVEAPQPEQGNTIAANIEIAEGASFPNNREFYMPPTATVGPSTTVTWINNDSVLHTVTSGTPESADSEQLFDSGLMASGATFQHTFNKVGAFDYWCTLHPFMTGQVIVKEGVTVEEGQQTPKTTAPPTTTATELPPDLNTTKITGTGSVLKLGNSKIAIDIPLVKGFENGNEIFSVVFDASDERVAKSLTNTTGFPVHFTPVLSKSPKAALGEAYIFTNGVDGNGHLGFQPSIVNAKPGDEGYSPLKQVYFVAWGQGTAARELKSINELVAAQQKGELTINKTDIIINSPAIKWQGGSLKVREDKVVNDDTPFEGGQITRIDTRNMTVTMIALRGYGPDGKTIYWSVTDATPFTDDITKGGIAYVPADEELAPTPVAVDFYQFINGIEGAGPQGFQPPIALTNLDDPNYSPMWRIYFVYWKDPAQARVLETLDDISVMREAGLIKVIPALEGKHIVNCPFFDQSTVLGHLSKYK